MRFGSLFTGGGGFDIGAKAAGLELVWGVEYIPEIAEWCNSQLGEHVRVANILQADPADFEPVDYLHASPPCPNFSVANSNKGETEQDVAMGEAVARFIRHHRPKYFSLENVYGYRHSQSWAAIVGALHECGYGFIVEHINSADFGVPQKRRRVIVRAVRDTFFSPAPMRPSHAEGGAGGLLPWVGWWEAVADIADTFPPSQLAPWQVRRLNGSADQLLVPGGNANSFSTPAGHEPSRAVGDTERVGNIPRAILGNGSRSQFQPEDTPSDTITGHWNQAQVRAVLVGKPPGHGDAPNLLPEDEPADVQRATRHDKHNAFIGSRVVALTPRALARFQTFPDWYELPEKKTLAVTIIGNAVPCLLAQRIVESLTHAR